MKDPQNSGDKWDKRGTLGLSDHPILGVPLGIWKINNGN